MSKENKKNIFKNKKGFTLIEVLIAVVIISVIAGTSWKNLSDSKERTAAANACTQVAAVINTARNYAVSGRAGISRVGINGNLVLVSLDGSVVERISLKASCGVHSFSYSAPDAFDAGNSGTINCVIGSITRTVNVTPYKATCD